MKKLKIEQRFIPKVKYPLKASKEMKKIEYITIHEANSAKNADDYADYMINGYFPESVHFIVDENKVVQILPLDRIAHHCGDGYDGPGNNTSIGIEITRSESNVPGRFEEAVDNAHRLVKLLMNEHNLSADRIKPHDFWDGSKCPKRLLKDFDKFVESVGD